MSDSRGAALEVLRGVRAGKPFNLSLDRSTGDLSTTDRRLTVEIVSGVLRNLLQLDRQLAPLIHQGWDGLQADVRDILRIGTYQIQFLSRVPRYAAVNTAVEMAKQSGNSQASGLVNAVLKQIPDEL
ncbi:MAG: transcription antitermination factor NusB, partial [Gemmatimonadales bacterium]